MSSAEIPAQGEEAPGRGGLKALLDTVFGFFVWAVHFLAIYIATAVSCQLGLGAADTSSRRVFAGLLILVTVAATALVVHHAVRRYRQQREHPRLAFRLTVTIGNDAIAAVAIAWQLLAVLLVPLCA